MRAMLDKIREAIQKPLQEMNIVVDSIEYVKDGSYYFQQEGAGESAKFMLYQTSVALDHCFDFMLCLSSQ